jgi:acetyl/propionyl-CoA carboxylase alpha subunit
MILHIVLGEKTYTVELNRAEQKIRIGKREFLYRKEGDLLFIGNKPFPFELFLDPKGHPGALLFRGKLIPVQLGTKKEKKLKSMAGGKVTAPLNGQVVKVSAKVGSFVEEGDVVLTLEAMKMENEIASPASGILKILHVKTGQVVKAGELLFEVEPKNDIEGDGA